MESKELALILVKYLLNKYEGEDSPTSSLGASSSTSVLGQKKYTDEEKELVASFDAFVKGDTGSAKASKASHNPSSSSGSDFLGIKTKEESKGAHSPLTSRVSPPSELNKSSEPSFKVKAEADNKPRLEQSESKPKPRLNFPPASEGAEEFPGAFDDFDFDNL
ncbi:MAG: hypothetical protein JJT94_11575 [Bernardetiaceae bacterium]|nr:hypothetical protein [Bernardetiaceae bacterium]